jgi:hypothetical protein
MTKYLWHQKLIELYEHSIRLYKDGNHNAESHFNDEQTAWLASIGLKPINVFDYAEDYVRYGEPDTTTFVLVAAARRDYFLHEQKCAAPPAPIAESDLPPKTEAFEGVEWLPRITEKARCFLEGGLCHDIMYGCGGDRKFLKLMDTPLADFLRITWACKADPARILEKIRSDK